MGTYAELTALAPTSLLPAAEVECPHHGVGASESYGTAGTPGGGPAVDGGSALADVAGTQGTGGDYGGRGAENDVLEHVLCLEGG